MEYHNDQFAVVFMKGVKRETIENILEGYQYVQLFKGEVDEKNPVLNELARTYYISVEPDKYNDTIKELRHRYGTTIEINPIPIRHLS